MAQQQKQQQQHEAGEQDPQVVNPAAIVAAFNQIAAADTFISCGSLELYRKYPVLSVSRLPTQHGPKIKAALQGVDVSEVLVVLPTRLNRLTDEQLEALNTMAAAGLPARLAYHGRISQAFDVRLSYDFP